jgi:hypothetical protein
MALKWILPLRMTPGDTCVINRPVDPMRIPAVIPPYINTRLNLLKIW